MINFDYFKKLARRPMGPKSATNSNPKPKSDKRTPTKCIGDSPRTEVLEGGFVYEYPYETNGTYYHPADTLVRLAQITINAKTPEELASAEILKKQVFEREMAILLELKYRQHKRIEDSVKKKT